MSKNYLLGACSAAVIAVGVSTPAFAQSESSEANDANGNVIIVTALKREQDLQDVPLSVTALSGDQLAERNENEIAEVAKLVPGFTFGDGISSAQRNIQIRGVGTRTFSRGVDQSVGTVVDGVVASSVAAALLDFSDIERLEVLRGPQGMLFGKNASAGLLNITTKNPTPDFEGGVGVSFAEENEFKVNGYLSGPLAGDTLMARISFYSNTRDAFIENVLPGGDDYNDRDEWGIRAKLLFQPSDNFDALFSYVHAESANNCCAAPAVSLFDPTDTRPAGPENDQISEFSTSINNVTVDVFSLEMNYQLGDHTLTSISAYTESDFIDDFRFTNRDDQFLDPNLGDATTTQFTQELRLTSPTGGVIDYVAGLYYFNKKDDRFYNLFVPAFGFGSIVDTVAKQESFAIFGQATFHASDSLRLTAGLRYNDENVSIDQTAVADPRAFFGTVGTRNETVSDEAFSWRLIGEADVAEDVMVYASVARGYKGPGANTLEGAFARPGIVAPEIPTNFEIGFRSEWWDNRVRLNGTLFHTKFEDFQTTASELNVIGLPEGFLANAGEVETQGFELEIGAEVTDNFNLNFAVSHIDAEIKEFSNAPCFFGQTAAQGCVFAANPLAAFPGQPAEVPVSQDLAGAELPNSPDWSFTVSGDLTIPMGDLPFDGFINAAYYWQDNVQYTLVNNPNTIGDSYGIADLSVGIEATDGSYRIQLFAKNLFDQFYVTQLLEPPAVDGASLAHRLPYTYTRRIGISAQINF